MAMLVSLTSFAAALGEGYEKVTNISSLSTGDKVVLYCDASSIGVTGWNNSSDAIVAATGFVEYTVTVVSGGVTLKDESAGKYIAKPTGNHFKYNATAGTCSTNGDGVLTCNSRYLCYNSNGGNYYRMYTSIGSYKPFYVYKVVATIAPGEPNISVSAGSISFGAVPVTDLESATPQTLTVEGENMSDKITVALSDQNFTISVTELPAEGGDITIAPATNLEPDTYETTLTLTSGTTTKTVTLTIDVKDVYTITWNALGVTTTTTVVQGSKLVLPEVPTCDYKTFVGWATSEEVNADGSDITFVNDLTIPTSSATYYAVFAVMSPDKTVEKTGTYTISSYTAGAQYAKNEEHKLDDDVTIYTTLCHFTTDLRIYSSSTNNGYVVSNELPGVIKSMSFNAGNKADNLVVFGSTDGEEWEEVGKIATQADYADYTLSFGDNEYTYFKLDVEGENQIRIKSFSITYLTATYTDYSTTCEAPAPTVIIETFDLTQEEDTRNMMGTYNVYAGDYILRIYGYEDAGTYQDDPATEENESPLLFTPDYGDALNAVVVVTIDEENNKEEMLVTATSADGKTIYNLIINIALPNTVEHLVVPTDFTVEQIESEGVVVWSIEGKALMDTEDNVIDFWAIVDPTAYIIEAGFGEVYAFGEAAISDPFMGEISIESILKDEAGNTYNFSIVIPEFKQEVEITVAETVELTGYKLAFEKQGNMENVSAIVGDIELTFAMSLNSEDNGYGTYFNDAIWNVWYGNDANGFVALTPYGDAHVYSAENFKVSFISQPDAEGNVTLFNFTLIPGDKPAEPTKHTVTILVNPEDAGTVTGAGEYEDGAEVTVTATANKGWIFYGWLDEDGECLSYDDNYTFQVLDDVTLTAYYLPTLEGTSTDCVINGNKITGTAQLSVGLLKMNLVLGEEEEEGVFVVTAESKLTIGDEEVILEEGIFMDYGALSFAAFVAIYKDVPHYITVMILNPTTTGVDNINTTVAPVKMIENGQLIIIKNDVQYNAQGAKL